MRWRQTNQSRLYGNRARRYLLGASAGRLLTLACLVCLFGGRGIRAQAPPGEDLVELQESAMKAAVQKVAPSVVQIETSGGTDLIGSGPSGPQIRKGIGPTTGLVVGPEGWIISSAFNFANKPFAIFVTVPGHSERYPAKMVATDHTRMLTLLKINSGTLPVAGATPKNEIKVGQWSLALGRTWSQQDGPPSVSIGIISAVGRIWGKAIQTDAKVSPVNYGGPLIDVQGRVQGILVPASPRGDNETAGVEWYDSGIGFAIPLEDVNAVLARLKQGQDLRRGLLGITLQSQDIYGAAPTVASISPDSAAARAGILPGDVITEVNGTAVVRQAQMMHLLGTKYEGDVVSVKVKRGDKEIGFPDLKLTGLLNAYTHPFLGILPMRDDPELGVEVRFVYPRSPADAAGVKAGDRILKIGHGKAAPQAFSGRDELLATLNTLAPGTEVTLEFRHKGAKADSKATLKLGAMPEAVPANLPEPASLKKALEAHKTVGPAPAPAAPKRDDKKKVETGLLERTNAARDHQYWIYVPEHYKPNVSHALLIWLHPEGKGKQRDVKAFVNEWQDFCDDHQILMVGPKAQNERGWLFSEADFVQEAAREAMTQYTIDPQRVIAHGMGSGGQMAVYLGFQARDLVRGVATTGSVVTGSPKQNVPGQRLAFFVIAGEKDPLAKAIAEGKDKLTGQKFPVTYREIAEMGHQYLDEKTLAELARWIDSIDRL